MDPSERRSTRPKARQSLAHIPSRSQSDSIDRQNATADLSVLARSQDAKSEKSKKRSRGKSLGPGGLEALRETDGNTNKGIANFQPRSILKPAIPLTPPKNIPTFDELRKKNTGRGKSTPQGGPEDLLIDFSTPAPNKSGTDDVQIGGPIQVADPFSPTKESRKEQEQSNNAAGDSEETRRQAEKQAILERRAARRKSMANRRVSFAPEATLHTWSVMELQEDSTTSSSSNSTRRQSSMTAAQSPASTPDLHLDQTPSTPPEQVEEPIVKASPAHQRDLHQKKRRRSSLATADVDVVDDEVYSSSPSGDLTTTSSPIRVEDSVDSDSDSDDDDGDTAMSMDDMTANTMNSQESNTQSSLDERLRQAASQAGTRGIDYDEHGEELSMEMVDGTVTSAFQPWAQQNRGNDIANEDQENVNPFIQGFNTRQTRDSDEQDETEGMAMDMTQAVGRIVQSVSSPKSSRKSVGNRRQSIATHKPSMGDDVGHEDETMDFTTVGGGILSAGNADDDEQMQSDGDMTMDFTTAFGGLRNGQDRRSSTMSTSEDNDTMDMTAAIGGILSTIDEHTETQTDGEDEKTASMDMTRADGKIFTQEEDEVTTLAEQQMQNEMHEAAHTPNVASSVIRNSSTHHLTSVASETGSPSLAVKARPSARLKAGVKVQSTTPKSALRSPATRRHQLSVTTTPEKQLTPVPRRAQTPEKTPLAAQVSQRGASPKKLFQTEIQARASPNISHKADPIFATDSGNGQHTPKYVLHAPKPHQHLRRRSSGVGIDKEGFGSPRISALLDRRVSIGDAAPEFKLEPAKEGRVKFEDPRQIEQEIDAERAQEEQRENGRAVMEREADDQHDENVTLQLKDLIESMTPRKNKAAKLKARKSLAVGSASGLLGKRPAELDDEEDEDERENTPKRLKTIAREQSPVKAIHLPKPPSKEETTGKLSKAQQLALDSQFTPHNLSPSKQLTAPSPYQTSRFRNATSAGERVDSFEGKLDNVIGAVDPEVIHPEGTESPDEMISLQDFLNMTNIHFIELSTTKRRHTMAQSMASQPGQGPKDQSNSLAASFIAASTTLPLLEMYQHATRELKTYISAGRKIVRSIEAETLVEQPPLFREYVEARPDIKLVMDNQFRNGKTNARLQSKEGWYTWRSQLVDGLHAGLNGIKSEMSDDARVLVKQQTMLDELTPTLIDRQKSLQDELSSLQSKLEQLESIDQDEFKAKRVELENADQSLAEKLQLLNSLQEEMHEKEDILSQATELKTEMRDQIAEADRVREEYRGWPAKDVSILKAKVDDIAKRTGWSLLAAHESSDEENSFGFALTLAYKGELEFNFYPSAFCESTETSCQRSGRSSKSGTGNTAPIRLTHISASEAQLTTEKKFILGLLQTHLRTAISLTGRPTEIKSIFETISNGWDFACKISEEMRLLDLLGVTKASVQNDDTLVVSLMLMKSSSRIDIGFVLRIDSLQKGTHTVNVTATPVHGPIMALLDPSRTKKVQIALSREAESSELGNGAFVGAIQGFEEWHNGQTQPKPRTIESKPVCATAEPPASPQFHRAVARSPLAAKKPIPVQKKALPIATSRQLSKPVRESPTKKQQQPEIEKENIAPSTRAYDVGHKPAITPEMQEAMMQQTPIKRVGALRRSPIGGSGF